VRDDFARRYPEASGRFVTVPNGFDPEAFADLEPRRLVDRDHLVLAHAGVFYGPRRPDTLFQAVRLLRDRDGLRKKPCLVMVGPPTCHDRCLSAIASDHGIDDCVLLPGQVSHRQALEFMRGSDIQVLVGFSGRGSELQVPAKLFEYIGVGQPMLALAPENGGIAEVVGRCGIRSELCDPDDPEHVAAGIARLDSWVGAPDGGGASGCRGDATAPFHRRVQVGRIAELLERISS
jgi:glycosyltransferase involved in cell wall biosynthesis